jgi:hypothetical protein
MAGMPPPCRHVHVLSRKGPAELCRRAERDGRASPWSTTARGLFVLAPLRALRGHPREN